jgi:hypothetical protein
MRLPRQYYALMHERRRLWIHLQQWRGELLLARFAFSEILQFLNLAVTGPPIVYARLPNGTILQWGYVRAMLRRCL